MMNFVEAMQYVAENEGAAVKRPDGTTFVWFDQTPLMAGMSPLGLRCELVDGSGDSFGFVPRIEDIVAETWEGYEPAPRPRL